MYDHLELEYCDWRWLIGDRYLHGILVVQLIFSDKTTLYYCERIDFSMQFVFAGVGIHGNYDVRRLYGDFREMVCKKNDFYFFTNKTGAPQLDLEGLIWSHLRSLAICFRFSSFSLELWRYGETLTTAAFFTSTDCP